MSGGLDCILFSHARFTQHENNPPAEHCQQSTSPIVVYVCRFENDKFDNVPLFVFGDFNFRLDTHHLIKVLVPVHAPLDKGTSASTPTVLLL